MAVEKASVNKSAAARILNRLQKPALGMNTTSVRALVDKLAKLTGQDIKVVVEDSAKLDAYLHPMGHIVITTGLMNFYEDDAEMAFIIGHELAHFLRGHYKEKSVERIAYEGLP